MTISADLIVPAVISAVLVTALIKKADILTLFCEGAREGMNVAFDLLPMLILLVTAVTIFTDSGAAGALAELLSPAAKKLGFPPECIPLMIMRPVSGSGSIAVLDGILADVPPDSFAARTSSVMMCAAETTLYTITVLFSSVKVKPRAGFFAASLTADLTCFLFAPITVRMLFKA